MARTLDNRYPVKHTFQVKGTSRSADRSRSSRADDQPPVQALRGPSGPRLPVPHPGRPRAGRLRGGQRRRQVHHHAHRHGRARHNHRHHGRRPDHRHGRGRGEVQQDRGDPAGLRATRLAPGGQDPGHGRRRRADRGPARGAVQHRRGGRRHDRVDDRGLCDRRGGLRGGRGAPVAPSPPRAEIGRVPARDRSGSTGIRGEWLAGRRGSPADLVRATGRGPESLAGLQSAPDCRPRSEAHRGLPRRLRGPGLSRRDGGTRSRSRARPTEASRSRGRGSSWPSRPSRGPDRRGWSPGPQRSARWRR